MFGREGRKEGGGFVSFMVGSDLDLGGGGGGGAERAGGRGGIRWVAG